MCRQHPFWTQSTKIPDSSVVPERVFNLWLLDFKSDPGPIANELAELFGAAPAQKRQQLLSIVDAAAHYKTDLNYADFRYTSTSTLNDGPPNLSRIVYFLMTRNSSFPPRPTIEVLQDEVNIILHPGKEA